MATLSHLMDFQLVPVVELVPMRFSAKTRESPSRPSQTEWAQYWLDSLADSGISDLEPLRPGSWHVPTAHFDFRDHLRIYLDRTFQELGGIDALCDPGCTALEGGLALRGPGSAVLIEPGCCADLGNVQNWIEAAAYRDSNWQLLWIGHPWVSVRYEAPCLVISDRHESGDPSGRWTVLPEDLINAANRAKEELARFAGRVALTLLEFDYPGDPVALSRKLAGLA